MKKKRKKGSINLKPWLAAGLVINVCAGLMYSPITSIAHLRIENAAKWDEQRLGQYAVLLHDIPCAQVNPNIIEGQFLTLPEARSASLSRNLFGYAVLRVRYRRPVAMFEGRDRVALSIDGVVYQANDQLTHLPLIRLPKSYLRPEVVMAGSLPWAKYADLAIRASKVAGDTDCVIVFGEEGSVWLNMLGGRVKLGSIDDLDAKFKVLQNRLASDPSYLSKMDAFILTSPSNPFVLRKKVETTP